MAKKKKKACIFLKLNSLVDREMVDKLYEASRAGVKITLLVRGACSLVTDMEGWSDNIKAYSLVDKYLEHTRIFIFNNGNILLVVVYTSFMITDMCMYFYLRLLLLFQVKLSIYSKFWFDILKGFILNREWILIRVLLG